MKPQLVMLKLTPMDAEEMIIGESQKFPAIELDQLVFLRLPPEEAKKMQDDGTLDVLKVASVETGKTFVILDPKTEVLKIEEKWEPLPAEPAPVIRNVN